MTRSVKCELRDGRIRLALWRKGAIGYRPLGMPAVEVIHWPAVKIDGTVWCVGADRLTYTEDGEVKIWWDADGPHDVGVEVTA